MLSHRKSHSRLIAAALALGLLAASCGADETQPASDAAGADETETPVQTEAPTPTKAPEPTEVPVDEPPIAEVEPTAPPVEVLEPLPFHLEGHRGARGLKPENSLQAFETALDIGVTTLEFDLHLTADNWVVVWHDPVLGADKCRFADHVDASVEFPEGGVPVASLTLEQLVDHQCDLNPDTDKFPDQENSATALAGDDYQPVTLTAVFEFVAAYIESSEKTDEQRARAAIVQFNIETKRDVENPDTIGDDFDGVTPGQFELEVLAAVEAAGLTDRVVIQSFDHRSLWAVRSINADIRLSALTSFEAPDLAEFAAQGASIWSPNFNVMTPELIDEAHSQGLLVIPWTVNTAEGMVEVLDRGADGLITDRPDIAASLG